MSALEREREQQKHQMAIATALVPLLRSWAETAGWHHLPEACTAELLDATGYCGGDAGHGGELHIRFGTGDSSSNIISCELQPSDMADDNDDDSPSYTGTVTLSAYGDWEQGGLVCALALLLSELLPIYTPKCREESRT
jgi:hypothetical protein